MTVQTVKLIAAVKEDPMTPSEAWAKVLRAIAGHPFGISDDDILKLYGAGLAPGSGPLMGAIRRLEVEDVTVRRPGLDSQGHIAELNFFARKPNPTLNPEPGERFFSDPREDPFFIK